MLYPWKMLEKIHSEQGSEPISEQRTYGHRNICDEQTTTATAATTTATDAIATTTATTTGTTRTVAARTHQLCSKTQPGVGSVRDQENRDLG